MIITREQTVVTFNIFSAKLTAQDIEARTGLKPDDFWKTGDVRGAFGAKEKEHGFILQSKSRITDSLDDHLKEMIKRLAPYAQKIGALAGECKIEMSCQIHRKQGPRLKFERDDLRWLGVMGARLDVDVHILNEPQKPASPGAGGSGGSGGTTGSGTTTNPGMYQG
ncbi:MAG TPA: DUF4279 domain-containing protein [Elusimicrobiota bacterium]|nr:DUF4279 domain-containing protein [Elusimicrobiota bacterium]